MQRLLLLSVLALSMIFAGCGMFGSDEESPSKPKDPRPVASNEDCTEAYTFAPASFIIDIASGQPVVLDPLVGDFPVYCQVAGAQRGLQIALEDKMIPEGDWKIYRFAGEWQNLASEVKPGFFLLKTRARLIDWVQ